MTFINGMMVDEEEPKMLSSDGLINYDIQRDYDIVWNESSDCSEVL